MTDYLALVLAEMAAALAGGADMGGETVWSGPVMSPGSALWTKDAPRSGGGDLRGTVAAGRDGEAAWGSLDGLDPVWPGGGQVGMRVDGDLEAVVGGVSPSPGAVMAQAGTGVLWAHGMPETSWGPWAADPPGRGGHWPGGSGAAVRRPGDGGSPAGPGLYRALRDGARSVERVRSGGRGPVGAAEAAGPPEPDPAGLDLIFQRDARRYGGAFPRY